MVTNEDKKLNFEETMNDLRNMYWGATNTRNKALSDLGYISALLFVNYGPDGKTFPGIVEKDDTIRDMVEKVLKFYHRQLSNEAEQKDCV